MWVCYGELPSVDSYVSVCSRFSYRATNEIQEHTEGVAILEHFLTFKVSI